ncbi:MAG: fibronectin type III domain-containing protein [Nitrospirota bacterium]
MELKIKNILIISFILSCFSTLAHAGWQGPTSVISGGWGSSDDQFGIKYGDTNDNFAGPFYIRTDGGIIIRDVINGRRKIYDPNGTLIKIVKCKENQAGEWNEECSIRGDYIQTTSDGNIWIGPLEYLKDQGYFLYTPAGQLVKTSTARPLELGFGKEEVLDTGRYKTTITYNDGVYVVVSDKRYDYYSRDSKKNLYETLPGLVDKFSPCGKRLGRLLLPEDVVFKGAIVPGKEQEILIHDQYGSPVVDISGNVYVWKRTPTAYSILKWTWVDDPNAPTGPDAPSGLTVMPSTSGLYLTWTASPGDPGCVTSYEISRATSAGGVGSTVGTVTAGTVKYNDTTVIAGTTYYYKVRAVSGSEFSPYTSEVSGKK